MRGWGQAGPGLVDQSEELGLGMSIKVKGWGPGWPALHGPAQTHHWPITASLYHKKLSQQDLQGSNEP